jgi:hypothetical protein
MAKEWRVRVSGWYDLPDIAAKTMLLSVYLADGRLVRNAITIGRDEEAMSRNVNALEDAKARNAWLSIFAELTRVES